MLSLCFSRPNYRMLRDVGKNYRTFSTMLMPRERSFRPQIKVIPKNMLVLLTLKPGSRLHHFPSQQCT